jgi:hypothetical protein
MGKTLLLVDFIINRDYIASNLCEKKDVKDNCCKGYCHLTKQLKQEEKREPSNSVIEQKLEFVSDSYVMEGLKFFFFLIQQFNYHKIYSLSSGFLKMSIQPPRF